MAESVQITLGANVSAAVQGLQKVDAAATKLNATVGFFTRQALNQVHQAAGAAGSALQELGAALGIGIGAMSGALAIGVALKLGIEHWTESIEIATAGVTGLGNATDATAKKLKRLLEESKKAGLLSDDEVLGFLKKIAEGTALSQDPDKAAKAIGAVTREMQKLLAARKEIADLQTAQDAANLRTVQGDSMLGAARGALAEAELAAAGLSPEEEGARRIQIADELHKRQLREFEQEEIAAKRRLEQAKLTEDKLATIAVESELELHQKKVDAAWMKLATTEAKIRQEAAQKRRDLDKESAEAAEKTERERLELLKREQEIVANVYEIERARIAGNYKLTDEQKRRATIASLTDQVALQPGDANARAQLEYLKGTPDPASTLQQTVAGFVALRNELGTVAQSMAQLAVSPFRGAVDGLSSSINGLIMGTMTWKQALVNLGQTILTTVVQAFSQMIAKMLVMKAIGFLGSLFTGPGKDFIGPMLPGKASGGVVGYGAYQLGEEGPEYVISTPTLRRLGTGFFDALQAGKTPAAAAGGMGGRPKITAAIFDSRRDALDALDSAEGEKLFIDLATRTKHQWS